MNYNKIAGFCEVGCSRVEFVMTSKYAADSRMFGGGSYKDWTEPQEPYYEGEINTKNLPVNFDLFSDNCIGFSNDKYEQIKINSKCVVCREEKDNTIFRVVDLNIYKED